MAPDNDPWLLAVWPGMGSVAILAGAYLVEELDTVELMVFDPGRHFDISAVEVNQGVVEVPRFPRSTLYGWNNPKGRDLLIMIGESQPALSGYEFCGKILDAAERYGAKRAFTFAATLAKLEPTDRPGIVGCVNQRRVALQARCGQCNGSADNDDHRDAEPESTTHSLFSPRLPAA